MVGWPDRRFTDLVGTEHPIVQAPMAGAGGVDLCVAAIEGGALGSLPCGMLSPEQVRNQAAEVREKTDGPFALNFFCHTMPAKTDDSEWTALLRPYYEEYGVAPGNGGAIRLPFDSDMAAAVEELRPPVVSFHFGLPSGSLLARVKATGAIVIGNATIVDEARWLEERGVDAIIAQGFEAGGHTGRFLDSDPTEAIGLFALVPLIADSVSVPVIAAGAIADGRAIAAALTLGASAVQLGTAYLHAPESKISTVHRTRLGEGGTLFTNLLSGGLARGLRGRLIDDLGPVRSEAPPYPLASAALAPIRAAAEKTGEYGFGPLWAGQAAPLGQALPAAELTRKLASDALAILGGPA
ncbi:MAG TPA: nitronate monooxygenase [Sphingomicrobium sp.]|nr:nitronate monooxygenase [Sphingomicrobium sp.]